MWSPLSLLLGFPGGASGKDPACQCRSHKNHGFNPWVRKISGGEHGNPPQYSCLENPLDGRAWWATVLGSQRVRYNWSNLARMHACTPSWEMEVLFQWPHCGPDTPLIQHFYDNYLFVFVFPMHEVEGSLRMWTYHFILGNMASTSLSTKLSFPYLGVIIVTGGYAFNMAERISCLSPPTLELNKMAVKE